MHEHESAPAAVAQDGIYHAGELMNETLSDLETIFINAGRDNATRTGYRWLDEQAGGLRRGSLTVIGSRPAMGKTALALNIVLNMICNCDHEGQSLHIGKETPVILIFPLEQSARALLRRLLCINARVRWGKFCRGIADPLAFARLGDTAATLADSRLLLCDTPVLTVEQIIQRARRVHRDEGDINLLVIDDLQGVRTEAPGNPDRSAATTALRQLALDLHIPILLLSQLNRDSESRLDKRPRLTDLRTCGTVMQDADLVLLLFRERYYLCRENQPVPPELEHAAEILVARRRYGDAGAIIPVNFDSEPGLFSDI